jgi:myo-inositol 2-dehydrogenase / D-chiro-inositol 1-dehydrogenase
MMGIALMGAGRMARTHAKATSAAGGRLITVYDVAESAAKSLPADAGASVAHSANLTNAQRCIDVSGPKASSVFLAFNRRFDAGHAELKKAIDLGE